MRKLTTVVFVLAAASLALAEPIDLKVPKKGQEGPLPKADYTIIAVQEELPRDQFQRYGSILVRVGDVKDERYFAISGIAPDNLLAGNKWQPEPKATFEVLQPLSLSKPVEGIKQLPHIAQDPTSRADFTTRKKK